MTDTNTTTDGPDTDNTNGSMLNIAWKPVGNGMRAVIEVHHDGEVIDTDTIDLGKTAKRSELATRIAERTGHAVQDIEARLLKATTERSAPNEPLPVDLPSDDLAEKTRHALEQTDPELLAAAERLLADPALIERIGNDIKAAGVAGEEVLALTLYMVGTSRLLSRPLAVIVIGATSSGKSFVIERVAWLFPPESKVVATQMTPKALSLAPNGSLSHRWIVGGERSRRENDDTAEATRQLREMISAGKLSYLMPVKDGNIIVTRLIQQEGPIAYVESTTSTRIFEEDANRCLILATDEGQAQTENILRQCAAHATGTVQSEGSRVAEIHFAAQRLLERREIVIPFAERLVDLFERFANRVECRRAYPMLLSMIQASALLHQRQREEDEDGRVIAEPGDYAVAARLLSEPMVRALGNSMSGPERRFLGQLLKAFDDPDDPMPVPFTVRDVMDRLKVKETKAKGHLGELEAKGYLNPVEAERHGRGRRPGAWAPSGRKAEEVVALPSVEELFAEEPLTKTTKFGPRTPK